MPQRACLLLLAGVSVVVFLYFDLRCLGYTIAALKALRKYKSPANSESLQGIIANVRMVCSLLLLLFFCPHLTGEG